MMNALKDRNLLFYIYLEVPTLCYNSVHKRRMISHTNEGLLVWVHWGASVSHAIPEITDCEEFGLPFHPVGLVCVAACKFKI